MLVALMAMALVAGCAADAAPGDDSKETPNEEPTYVYNNGTFVGYSDESRGHVRAEVTIQNDEITAVKITEYTNQALAKDPETYGREGAFEIGLLAEVHEYLEGAFVAANSAEVDIFTGATSSSNKSMQAVERALLKAEVNATPGLIDGVYQGRSEIGQRGYSMAKITIAGGVISEVELWDMAGNEEDGFEAKPEDYQWEAYHVAMEEMSAAMVAANSAQVDTVAEATSSGEKWIDIVNELLERASK